jgi:hypothetical protein
MPRQRSSSFTRPHLIHAVLAVVALASAAGAQTSVSDGRLIEDTLKLREVEGLDPGAWSSPTVYYVDPYTGSDSNAGTSAAPFCSFAKAKAVMDVGVRVKLRNARVFSPLSFVGVPAPSGTCQVGEQGTHAGGTRTARLLDLDLANGVAVFATVSGAAINSTSTFTGSVSGCVLNLSGSTQRDSLEADCVNGGGGASDGIDLIASSTFADRVVGLIEGEDALGKRPLIHCDGGRPDSLTIGYRGGQSRRRWCWHSHLGGSPPRRGLSGLRERAHQVSERRYCIVARGVPVRRNPGPPECRHPLYVGVGEDLLRCRNACHSPRGCVRCKVYG